MVQNKALIFNKTPSGAPKPGQDLTVEDIGFDLDADAPSNGLLVKILYSSFDPYLRGRMREQHIKSYLPAFTLGQPIESFSVFRVYRSNNPEWKTGDHGVSMLPVAEYGIIEGAKLQGEFSLFGVIKIDNKYNINLTHYVGSLGMPGLTAYGSFYDIGKPKKGDTIFISAASGAVGQLAGQLAKHEGLVVIASVGSDEKLRFIQDLGFLGFNYKKEKPLNALRRLAPNGIEIYLDNVGGEQLEAALEVINVSGRIIACGHISQYNLKPEEKYGIKNTEYVCAKQILMHGFIVSQYGPSWYAELLDKVGSWIGSGEMKPQQALIQSIENGPQGFVDMLSGKNFGKSTLVIGE